MLVLVPWLALIAYTQADERKEAIANVHRDAMRLIRITTSNQAAQIEAARQFLTAFARLPQLQARDPAACNAFLSHMLAAYPLHLNLGLAEVDGNIACSAVTLDGPVNVGDREYFNKALQTRKFAIGDYQVGRVTRLPAINYAYPMANAAGEVRAIVHAAQSLGWLTAALANVESPRGGVLGVVDRNGTVLAHLPDAGERIGKPMPEQQVLAMLSRSATCRGMAPARPCSW
ncbi:MAG: hypothetical protein U1F15_10450 [Burkholderiales bacterium]